MHYCFELTYFKEVGLKYRNIFFHFLVQMKTSKSHSKINWPFLKYFPALLVSRTLEHNGYFFSKIHFIFNSRQGLSAIFFITFQSIDFLARILEEISVLCQPRSNQWSQVIFTVILFSSFFISYSIPGRDFKKIIFIVDIDISSTKMCQLFW